MEKKSCNMSNLFSDLEGLRIAIDMEARGRDFYKKAYEQAETKSHKDLFMFLMNEESKHYEQFTGIYQKLRESKNYDSDDYLFDPEISKYLTALAEPCIFPKDKEERAKTLTDIIKAAMQDEKDSILFYDALAKYAKFEEARNIFNLLKEEEQKHVVKLREILNLLA